MVMTDYNHVMLRYGKYVVNCSHLKPRQALGLFRGMESTSHALGSAKNLVWIRPGYNLESLRFSIDDY